MALVMLRKKQLALDLATCRIVAERLLQVRLLVELLLDPHRDRHPERGETPGRIDKIGLNQALEFDKGLFEKDDVFNPVEVDIGRIEAIANGCVGKGGVMFFACKALLLSGGDDLTVVHEGSRAVVIEG